MPTQFPPWLRRAWASGPDFGFTKEVLGELRLHTVCQSARCPNLGECWSRRTATVMVLGNTCTRNCTFCSVPSGKPEEMDSQEPRRVAEAVLAMGLRHAVVTTVVRDDFPDGGASHIAQTITEIKALNPETTVEVLVSDYHGERERIETILDAEPEIFGHNIETVARLYGKVRDRRFDYPTSLDALRVARMYSPRAIVKSALMVGHGETPDEVRATVQDLVAAGCEVVYIGQYLRPSLVQREVVEFVTPEQFAVYETMAYEAGCKFVVSGPFVRSSYRSEEVLATEFGRRRLETAHR